MKKLLSYLIFTGIVTVGVSADAQHVNWSAVENSCSDTASKLDAAWAIERFPVSDNGRVLKSAKDISLNLEKKYNSKDTTWDVNSIKWPISEAATRRKGAVSPQLPEYIAYALYEACLKEAFASEWQRAGGGKSAQSASNPGSTSQNQSGQQDLNQSIALAQQNQAKAEEKRIKDGRRRNRPDLETSNCLTPDMGPRDHGFSVFKNSCSHPVRYTYCVLKPKEGSLAAFVDCEAKGMGGGAGTARANDESAAPMRGGTEVHWVGCKPPATAISRGFINGRIVADCIDLGA